MIVPEQAAETTFAQRTFNLELRRALATGVIESANSTFLMLIAVRCFDADRVLKGILASSANTGYILGPLIVYLVGWLRFRPSIAAALLHFSGALAFLITVIFPGKISFTAFAVIAVSFYSCIVPLTTQIYQDNYPATRRGKLFSRAVALRILSGVLFGAVAGALFKESMQGFEYLLLTFAACLLYSGFCLVRCPSKPLVQHESGIFRGFRHLQTDALFAQTIICWMLLGFGNLMMWPLRVEYLANPVYGLSLNNWEIALLVTVYPNIARLLLSPLWGRLFDRVNFFKLRVLVNVTFMVGIISFFTSSSWLGLVTGAIVFGAASAGGEIAWSLWVTKIAPAEKVADYMAVHTFMTGMRGVLAPVTAFQLLHFISIEQIAMVSLSLIIIASLFLFSRASREETTRRFIQH